MLRFGKNLLLAVLLLALAAGFYQQAVKSYLLSIPSKDQLHPPPLIDLTPAAIRILTLNHPQIYQDFLQIWMIQLLSAANTENADAEEIQRLAIRGAEHGLAIDSFFMACCFTVAHTMKRPELCFKISEAGLKNIPNSWRLPMIQGYIDYFLLQNKARAAVFYSLAASRNDSPEYVASLVEKVLRDESLTFDDLQRSMQETLNIPGSARFQEFLREVGRK